MTATVDVGDAIELTFSTTTGATVTVTWINPDGVEVIDTQTVPESPASSGQFPVTLLPDAAGVWTALFTAAGAATAVEAFYVRANTVPQSPPPYATVGEVAELYGALTTAQEGLVAALLRRASAMLRARWPDIGARITNGTLTADAVAHAAVNMVLRVMRNPAGMRSESVGPFSRTFDTATATGLLGITDAEVAMIAPLPEAGTPYAGTIMARPGLAPTPIGLTDVYRWRR
jgi:hypothetical protein